MEIKENSNRYRRLKKALFGDPTGKIRTFAIISPENPLGIENSTEEEFKKKFAEYTKNKKLYNKEHLSKLKGDMIAKRIKATGDIAVKYGGFDFVPLKGSYMERENSLMLFNLTLDDAKGIARDYGQESFYFAYVSKDPEKQPSTIAFYKTHNSCQSYKLEEITRTVTYEEDAEDFFSKFGLKFRINMREFCDNVIPIKNQGMFEESFTRPTFMLRASARRSARQPVEDTVETESPLSIKEVFDVKNKNGD